MWSAHLHGVQARGGELKILLRFDDDMRTTSGTSRDGGALWCICDEETTWGI